LPVKNTKIIYTSKLLGFLRTSSCGQNHQLLKCVSALKLQCTLWTS